MMAFIDDYTKMSWVYLLRIKSQAFETFINFHVWIENEAQSHIDSLHANNGREYTSNEFENYLHPHGAQHQTIAPYNPQQNDVAKRINKTILNMVWSMMLFKNVKLMFLDYVILCVEYVKNKCPSHALRNNTPYEMWYGHIPLVTHIRVCWFYLLCLDSRGTKNKT